MNVIVVGCGRVGAGLASRLHRKGHQVTIIDQVAQAFENLAPDFRGRTLEGEALNQEVLIRAGIGQAGGLAAVTNSDSLNAVVAHVAHAEHHVPCVVIRNYDPRWRPVQEAFGLQVVSSASWGAQRIEELLFAGELRTVYSAGNGEVGFYEFVVPGSWDGLTLQDLLPEGQCHGGAITRAGQAMLPSGSDTLAAGDVVVISATLSGREILRERLARAEEA